VSGTIFGFCSEHLSVVFRGIGFIQSQTQRNSTTSTIAEANIDITPSIFVRSRQRLTSYQLKRSGNIALSHVDSTVRDDSKRICLLCSAILHQLPGTAFKQGA